MRPLALRRWAGSCARARRFSSEIRRSRRPVPSRAGSCSNRLLWVLRPVSAPATGLAQARDWRGPNPSVLQSKFDQHLWTAELASVAFPPRQARYLLEKDLLPDESWRLPGPLRSERVPARVQQRLAQLEPSVHSQVP